MPSLGDHLNVYDTVVATLRRKGYQVWYDARADLYYAELNGWDFASKTPVGLVGLVALFEDRRPSEYREYWWKAPEVGLIESLPPEPERDYVPVYCRK